VDVAKTIQVAEISTTDVGDIPEPIHLAKERTSEALDAAKLVQMAQVTTRQGRDASKRVHAAAAKYLVQIAHVMLLSLGKYAYHHYGGQSPRNSLTLADRVLAWPRRLGGVGHDRPEPNPPSQNPL
jgi:hypothetical protein